MSPQKTHGLCNRVSSYGEYIFLGTIERVQEETEENIRAKKEMQHFLVATMTIPEQQ